MLHGPATQNHLKHTSRKVYTVSHVGLRASPLLSSRTNQQPSAIYSQSGSGLGKFFLFLRQTFCGTCDQSSATNFLQLFLLKLLPLLAQHSLPCEKNKSCGLQGLIWLWNQPFCPKFWIRGCECVLHRAVNELTNVPSHKRKDLNVVLNAVPFTGVTDVSVTTTGHGNIFHAGAVTHKGV